MYITSKAIELSIELQRYPSILTKLLINMHVITSLPIIIRSTLIHVFVNITSFLLLCCASWSIDLTLFIVIHVIFCKHLTATCGMLARRAIKQNLALIRVVRFGHGKPSGQIKLVTFVIVEAGDLRLGIALDPAWQLTP